MTIKINNETEYKSALESIEIYLQKGFDNLNDIETKELQRISILIEAYEEVNYPLPFILEKA